MLDLETLSGEVIASIAENKGWTGEYVKNQLPRLSVAEAFDAYCCWHGIIGWSSRLSSVLENIKKAEVAAVFGKSIVIQDSITMPPRAMPAEQLRMQVWHTATSRNRAVVDHCWDPTGVRWYWFAEQPAEEGWTRETACEAAR